jgi:trehalose/maltose hydrolase-like predicted phosphorylase
MALSQARRVAQGNDVGGATLSWTAEDSIEECTEGLAVMRVSGYVSRWWWVCGGLVDGRYHMELERSCSWVWKYVASVHHDVVRVRFNIEGGGRAEYVLVIW